MTCTIDYLKRILNIYNPARYSDFSLVSGGYIAVRYGSIYLINGGYYGSSRNYGVVSQKDHPPGNIFSI